MSWAGYALLAFLHVAFFCSVTNCHSIHRDPLEYLTTIDKPEIQTPWHRVDSLSSFDLTFGLHDKQERVKLKLSPNHDVIAEGATVQYLAQDGSVHRTETIDRTEHRVFMGQAYVQHTNTGKWSNVGWARIMIYKDGFAPVFEGAFQVNGNHHHIQTRHNYAKTKHDLDPTIRDDNEDVMIVWRDSDVLTGESLQQRALESRVCSSDDLSFNVRSRLTVSSPIFEDPGLLGPLPVKPLSKRQRGQSLISTIGSTAGCPTTKQVALVGIATDCTYTADFNSTASARANIIAQINQASVQYEDSFNITLGIRNLTISDAACPPTPAAATPWNIPCSSDVTIGDRLSLFSTWRGENSDNNAFWTLLSTCNTGSAVGLAWLGQACVPTSSSNGNTGEVVSSTNVVVRTSAEWQVIAHEVGHTFGAVHDCTTTTCNDGTSSSGQCCPLSAETCSAGGAYIMNPASGPSNDVFSPCTVGNICSAIGSNRVRTSCLTANRNVTTINGGQCGNGIVEVGEECDCGGTQGCGDNSCCDPTTCTFKGNAVCDTSNDDCCTSSCQFASSTTVCRPSSGPCDTEETCSGTTALCPADSFASNGDSCNNSTDLYCASGECTSRDLQCRTILGSGTQSNYTGACFQSSCQISCSPSETSSSCYQMQQFFIDGTECGNGGSRCLNGVCRGSSTGGGNGGGGRIGGGGGGGSGDVSDWVSRNRGLVIGLAVGVGGLIVLVILLCCVRSWRRRRMIKQVRSMPPMMMLHPPVIYR